MPVIGFLLKSIRANSDEEKMGVNVNINSAPKITDVKKKKFDVVGMDNTLSIEFKFDVDYEPEVGHIEMIGEVAYQTEDIDEIIEKWNSDKQIKDNIAVEVLNIIIRRCVSRAITISEELRLPPPISFPTVKTGKKEKSSK